MGQSKSKQAKSKKVNKKDLQIAEEYYEWAKDHYNEAYDMSAAGNPAQESIDFHWSKAAQEYWIALSLGHEGAARPLFKCFNLGHGAPVDNLIAAYMYGIALKLGDQKCSQIEEPPVILESMKPAIDTLSELVIETRKKIPNGAAADEMIKLWNMFDEKFALLTGKLVSISMLDKVDIPELILEFKSKHPGWHYLGLGDECEFADVPDDASAAAGIASIHFDAHH